MPVQCNLMGAVISLVPPSRNGDDVHHLWGSGSAQPGWAPACSQLDGCERTETHAERSLPRAATLAGLLSPDLWGCRRGPGLMLLL